MNRKQFLTITIPLFTMGATTHKDDPTLLHFKDDGIIPNNRFPLILYRNAFQDRNTKGAEWLEKKFLTNNWSNSWRNGIFDFQHYHSLNHEVLGIYSGEALVLLGGDKGEKVKVQAGDIIIIPAGVGHKNLGSSSLGVVGAYPNGGSVDILRGDPSDRPTADENIAKAAFPSADPFQGKDAGLITIWKKK